ncbi:MAG: hypothetical protein WEB19_03415 [Acidimicrobiia bacterium]
MSIPVALAVGIIAGLHSATWGMFKDAPYEGFAWRTYLRSPVLSGVVAVCVAAAGELDSTTAANIAVLFGLTYVIERGIIEFYKTFVREENQDKYSIPMQLSVRGTVVTDRRTRLLAGLGYAVAVLAIVLLIDAVGRQGTGGLVVVLLVGSLGGWISAVGGAWKDAPVEGFQPLKFVRSPLVALGYALLLATLTTDPVYAAMGALGYTVATLETYKTFFKPNIPRGKFAGKDIRYPEWLEQRYRFVPLYVAIWIGIIVVFVVALAEPHTGLL